MNYDHYKLNEIYRDTWPNLGWAKRMNEDNLPVPDDMAWVNLNKEEIEELRSKKHTLTEYGREQLRKLMTHEEMLEEAAKREAMAMEALENAYEENSEAFGQLAYIERMEREKVAREEVMKIAVGAINKYSDALKKLSETEKVELREQLEALKKENFQKVAKCCMDEYRDKNGEFPDDEHWVYMYSEYFATGEGQTVSLMVTQAVPHGDDYDPNDKYKTVNTKAFRAVREFHKEFGTWELYGLRFMTREQFYMQCAYFIPPVMMKLANANCYKHFHTQVHYNFS